MPQEGTALETASDQSLP